MEERTYKQALPAGYRLQNFRVLRVLGVGGFGVTYLAQRRSPSTGGWRSRSTCRTSSPCARAPRCSPSRTTDRADFEWGLQRFLDEAKTLARFRHPNLVRVVAYFEANRTAYIVMDYEEGEPLDRLLERHGRLTETQLKRVLLPIVDGLREVHAAGFLHRDIKPSNVFVRRADETPVLLDFGAARQALGRKSKSLTAVASAGYSPPEQYESEGEQGPWTDIYALSALCYRAITGKAPMEAPRRQSSLLAVGELGPAAEHVWRAARLRAGYSAVVPGGGGLGLAGDRDRAAAKPGRRGWHGVVGRFRRETQASAEPPTGQGSRGEA